MDKTNMMLGLTLGVVIGTIATAAAISAWHILQNGISVESWCIVAGAVITGGVMAWKGRK